MENPWLDFSHSKHMIHPLDEEAVVNHNSHVKLEHKFLPHMVPEPFVGEINAPVLILLANPGATADDLNSNVPSKSQKITQLSLANLRHEVEDFPLFHLHPSLEGTDGYKWYRSKLRLLIEHAGFENVAANIATAELCPYHSMNWKKPRLNIPTQQYTNHIVRNAMKRRALILVARSFKFWIQEIPELGTYQNLLHPKSTQNASVTPGNYGDSEFKLILKKIQII